MSKKTVTLRVIDLFAAKRALDAISDRPGALAVMYAKNSDILEKEIKSHEAFKKKPSSYTEYERKQRELLRSYALKDEEGNPLLHDQNGNPSTEGHILKPDGSEEYKQAKEDLEKEYEEAIKEYEEACQRFKDEVLYSEVKLELFTVNLDDLPSAVRHDETLMTHLSSFVNDESVRIEELTGKELKPFLHLIEDQADG